MAKQLHVMINDKLYNMLKAYCDKHGMSQKEFLEQVLYEFLELKKDTEFKKEMEQLFKIRIKIRRNKAYLKYLEEKVKEYENKATIYELLEEVLQSLEELEQYARDYFYHIVGVKKDLEDIEYLKSQIAIAVKEVKETLQTARQILIKIKR